MSDQAQRTEKPTPRRREKARREGRVATSREVAGAAQFVAFAAVIGWAAPDWVRAWLTYARSLLQTSATTEVTPASAVHLFRSAAIATAVPLALPLVVVALAGMAAQLAMTRGALSTARLAPELSRLNGFRRLAEMPGQAPATIAQAAVVVAALALAVRAILVEHLPSLLRIPFGGPEAAGTVAANAVSSVLWRGAAVLTAVALVDFLRQRRRFESQLRMTKEEVRQEAKESDGDPLVKQRIRRIQRDLSRRRMMQEVPSATAVIVNPTHYAVAIRYSLESPGAPKVVAKGKNYIALRIREIAEMHKVPIIENKPLAQALYKGAEVGQEIPAALYRAVAEVLAYIYKVMGGKLPG
jgi:flagellar biosynthetic protein FlhB